MKYLGKPATKAKPKKQKRGTPPQTKVEIKFVTYLMKSELRKGLHDLLRTEECTKKGENHDV